MLNVRPVVTFAACSLWLAACARPAHAPGPIRASAVPQATHLAGRMAAPSPMPRRVALATPSAMPSVSATPSAAPTPTVIPVPKLGNPVPRVAPDAAPRILAVAVSETTVHPGDRVSGSVVTTSNVASVEARIGGYAMSLAKTGVGRFQLSYTVAPLPWFVRGNFAMRVIAKNTRGATVERTIPLTVR